MKTKHHFAGLTLLVGLLAMLSQHAEAKTKLPNIIFLLGDDQAWWDYSFMRRDHVEADAMALDPSIYGEADTPNIDRLADEGLAFTHGYATTPICRPSLMSIITGTHAKQHFVSGNKMINNAPDDTLEQRSQVMQTLPRILHKRLGYLSFQTGKWWEGDYANGGFTHGDTKNSESLSARPSQWSGGFPSYAEARHGDWGLLAGRADYITDELDPEHPINYANTIMTATNFMDEQIAADQPFFLWYAPMLPHTPHDPPNGLKNIYDARIDEPDEVGDYFAKYYANISRFDGGVGAILDYLDENHIADNTIVVLICDNGWINQNDESNYAPKSKGSPYDGGQRTPVLIRWPDKIHPGSEIEPDIITTPVSLIDLVPTILAAVGLETPPEMRGVNLLDRAAVTERTMIFGDDYDRFVQNVNHPGETLEYTWVRQGGWKLIRSKHGATELYHLYDDSDGSPVDPFETNDLSGVETALTAELSAAVLEWYEEDTSMEWQGGASQTKTTNLTPIGEEMGQTFTPETDQQLAAVRVVLNSIGSQSLTLEVRELDGAGAPLGSPLATATLGASVFVEGVPHWYNFVLDEPIQLTPGVELGFRLIPSSGSGGFEVGYRSVNSYAGGKMYYPGVIDSEVWTLGSYDMAFETLLSNYRLQSQSRISAEGTNIRLNGLMSMKGMTWTVERSPDLEYWTLAGTDPNLDALIAYEVTLDGDREFYRLVLDPVGEAVTVQDEIPEGTIYGETFSGAGSNLNGVSPETTINGNVWTAPQSITFADSGAMSNSAASAYLPFRPENGRIYTLSVSADIQTSGDTNGWVAFGFFGNNPSTNPIYSTGQGYLWALSRNDTANPNQVLHHNSAGGAGMVAQGNFVNGQTSVIMSIVLDTTGGSGNWTCDWLVNNLTRLDDYVLDQAFESAINGVGIGKSASTTSILLTNFVLSVNFNDGAVAPTEIPAIK